VLALPDFDERALALGLHRDVAFHVRSGTASAVVLLDWAARLAPAGRCVLINDRIDLVPAARAAGVHLPGHGLPVAVARHLLGPSALIGRSVHDPVEARAAHEDGADYVFLGPIWDTPSHPGMAGLGLAVIREARPARVIAIGGITPERAAACRDAGAFGVAAISALWRAGDPAAAAEAFLLSFTEAQ